MGLSNYPPGVTGNEPQISGIWPAEQVIDQSVEDLTRARDTIEDALSICDDQGMSFNKKEVERQYQLIQLIDDVIDDINSRMPPEEDW